MFPNWKYGRHFFFPNKRTLEFRLVLLALLVWIILFVKQIKLFKNLTLLDSEEETQ